MADPIVYRQTEFVNLALAAAKDSSTAAMNDCKVQLKGLLDCDFPLL